MSFTGDNIVTIYALLGLGMFSAIILNSESIAQVIVRLVQ